MPTSREVPPERLERSVLEVAGELFPALLAEIGAKAAEASGQETSLEDTTRVGEVWPLYHLGLDRIVDGTGLDGARMVGWRALVEVAGRPAALADVNHGGASAGDVRQMTYGPVVAELASIKDSNRSDGAFRGGEVEERLLQMPGIYLLAIWEHDLAGNADDVLVPLEPVPAPVEAHMRYAADELLAILQPLARARLRDDETRARRSVPPSDQE